MFSSFGDALQQSIAEITQSKSGPLVVLPSALALYPYSAELHFLHGSDLAQRGEYGGAVKAFTESLLLKPDMDIVRFQLAFLHYSQGNIELFKVLLTPILQSPVFEKGYLSLFAKGCVAIADGETESGRILIDEGISTNQENEALNDNMRRLLALFAEKADSDTSTENSFQSALLDIYKQQKH